MLNKLTKLQHRSGAEMAVWLLIITLLVSIVILLDQKHRAEQQLVERALNSARVLAQFSSDAQRQYAASVKKWADISTYDTDQLHQHYDLSSTASDDFPATFSRKLTQRFSTNNEASKFLIYSNDPFAHNKDRQLDAFAQEALNTLQQPQATAEYWVLEAAENSQILRLATPMVMQQNCVNCHNQSHWGLHKSDWQVGDVRGVREVQLRLANTNLDNPFLFYSLLILSVVAITVCLCFVIPAVRNEVRHRLHFQDLSQSSVQKAERYRSEAMHDPLTGLNNRRYLEHVLKYVIDNDTHITPELSLILFDIDHFKAINDTYGHLDGDKVLIETATLLKAHCRDDDTLVRFGGEEFALIMPTNDSSILYQKANAIRQAIADTPIQLSGNTINITISGGIAIMKQQQTIEDLFREADALLYQAKASGRNKVCDQGC